MREQLIQYVNLLFAGAQNCEDIRQEILQNTLDRYDDLIAEGKVPEAAYRLAITGIGDISEILGTKPQAVTPHPHTPAAEDEKEQDTPAKKLLRAIAVGLYILCPVPVIVLSEFLGWDTLGLCGTLAIAAVATVLIILGAKKDRKNREDFEPEQEAPKSELQKSISGMVWAIGITVYFLLSFKTNYWHITWVIFPLLAALDKLLCVLVAQKESGTSGSASSAVSQLQKSISSVIWAVGLAIYFILSFATNAWYITWLVFPITGAVQGLARAILDLKEAVNNEI